MTEGHAKVGPRGADAVDYWRFRHAQETATPPSIVAYPVDPDGEEYTRLMTCPGCREYGDACMCGVPDARVPHVWQPKHLGATLRKFQPGRAR